MYPSFTSLSQRERKRNELLDKAKRRVAQANVKREMYSDAAWSSDVGKTIDVNRSSTIETTKSVSSNQPIEKDAAVATDDKSSQTIPEASNVSPVMVDNETSTDRIDQTDRHIQASPTTADVGVDNGIDMVDASVSVKPSTVDEATNTVDEATNTSSKPSRLDTEDQVEARKWIKAFFTKYPNWVALRLHPVRKKDHKDDKRYVIGETGSLLSIKNGKKYKRYEYIDWVATEEKVRNIWYDAESQSIDEVGAMRDEENLTKPLLRLEKKRSGDELEELDVILKDRRLPDITFARKATSTTSDDEQSRMKMLWIISKNKEMLESNGIIKSIIPDDQGACCGEVLQVPCGHEGPTCCGQRGCCLICGVYCGGSCCCCGGSCCCCGATQLAGLNLRLRRKKDGNRVGVVFAVRIAVNCGCCSRYRSVSVTSLRRV
jgi:hypothetical protein